MTLNTKNIPVKAKFATYAVLTAEDPDSFVSTLASGKYPFKRIEGNSVVIGGISLDTAKNLSRFYKQQSFIFIRRGNGNELAYEMWAKDSSGEYEMTKHDGSPLGTDTGVEDAIGHLDNFLVSVVLSKPGQYGKLMEGLAGGSKTGLYYYQCRCTGMAGASISHRSN